jgi:RimJ/RimL family protein N-acetyltransferase
MVLHASVSHADINNAPMIRAFQRAGYKQFASRRQYQYQVKNDNR